MLEDLLEVNRFLSRLANLTTLKSFRVGENFSDCHTLTTTALICSIHNNAVLHDVLQMTNKAVGRLKI